jgi:hypothetical protein
LHDGALRKQLRPQDTADGLPAHDVRRRRMASVLPI